MSSPLRAVLGRLSVAFAVSACAAEAAPAPLGNTRDSAEHLVEDVLEAALAKDGAALEAFLVTKDEYERFLWPEMPDREYTPFEFVWSINATNNRKALRQLVAEFGGLDLEFVSVSFDEDPEVYQNFTLHPGARVVVRRKDTGEEGVLPSFDVMVEYGRGWKLMNYDEL